MIDGTIRMWPGRVKPLAAYKWCSSVRTLDVRPVA